MRLARRKQRLASAKRSERYEPSYAHHLDVRANGRKIRLTDELIQDR
jgi:hypothetical protein